MRSYSSKILSMLLAVAIVFSMITVVVTAAKPDDYSVEIYYEDFTDDTTMTGFNQIGVDANIVDNTILAEDDIVLIGGEDKGDFVKLDYSASTQSYFRMKYDGTGSALDNSGYQVSDLGRMQVSFDICPSSNDKEFAIRFYDQFSSSSTKADSLVTFKNNGTIAFLNSEATVEYTANNWISIDMFFTFTGTSGSYNVYIDDEEVVSGVATTNLIKCIESFGSATHTPSFDYTYYLDNLRIAIPERFAINSTTPANEASDIAIDGDVIATFNYDLAEVTNDMVTISGGTVPVTYQVSKSGKVMTVDFTSELEYNTTYSVTFKENIATLDNDLLGSDYTICFTTMLNPEAPAPKPDDYSVEIYNEDFTDDEAISGFNIGGVTATLVDSTVATGLIGGEDKGDFAQVDFNTGVGSNYFRMEYNAESALDRSGYQVSDLSKMQASFDICPTATDKAFNITLYDRLGSSTDTLYRDAFVYFNNNGTITFRGSDATVDYVANKWLSFDLYFDFTGTDTGSTYDLYIDGQRVVNGADASPLFRLVESIGSPTTTPSVAYTYYIDNFRLAIPERFTVGSTNPANGASDVDVNSDVVATFNFDLADVTNDMVTITGGTNPVVYDVSKDGRVMVIDIQSELENGTPYTVTFKENIAALNGDLLGINLPITFTTVAAAPLPGTPAQKPNDYLEELYFEDFTGDTEINTTDIEINTSTGTYAEITDSTTGLAEVEDKGDYAKVNLIVTEESEGTNTTFRVQYGKASAPVQSSGYSVGDLKNMQMSFDICPTTTDKSFEIRFYDKFGFSSTKGDSLIKFNSDGKIKFMNDDSTELSYVANKWMHFDIYLEFTGTSGKYSVYINDEAVVENIPTTNLLHCAESFGINASLSRGTSYQVLMDNLRIAIKKQFAIKETSPANGAENVAINQDLTAKFNSVLADVTQDMVTVTGGTVPPAYNVSKENDVILVDFTSALEYNTPYTVTFKSNISALNGDLLGTDKVVTFTTVEESLPPVINPSELIDYNTVIYEEDFNGDTVINSSDITTTGVTTSIVNNSTAPGLNGGEDKGDFVNVKYNTGVGTNYFRLWYGGSTYPVQRSGYSVSQLKKMQASFEICPTATDKAFSISFYDKFSSPETTLRDDIINFKNNGRIEFLNTATEVSYTANQWMKIDVFFEFTGTSGVYTVVIDGNKIVDKASTTKLVSCFESFGSPTLGSVSSEHSYYLDNLKILIPAKLELKNSNLANNATGVNIADDVKFTFSNVLNAVDKSLVTIDGVNASDYDVAVNNNILTVKFVNGMELNKNYTITISKDITDVYGQSLGTEDKTITYTTSAEEKMYTSPAEFNNNVKTTIVNAGDSVENVALILVVVDNANKVTMYNSEYSLSVGEKKDLEINFDTSSLTNGEKVYAFITDGSNSLNLLSDAYYAPGEVYNSASATAATVEVNSPTMLLSVATVKGNISIKEKRNLILKIKSSAGSVLAAYPVQTDANGAFVQDIELEDFGPEVYYLSVTGYNIPECDDVKIVYMSNVEKLAITTAINNASSSLDVKATLNNDEYKNKMCLDSKFYCDNIYTSLYEQRPYATYGDIIVMINRIDNVLAEINNADWSVFSSLFATNSDLIFNNSTKLSVYNGLNINQKNEVNKILVDYLPVASFVDLCKFFDAAVTKYIASISANDNAGGGGGGGGAGGGGGGVYVPSTNVTDVYEIVDVTPQITEDNKNFVFTDLDTVDWAKESIYKLCDRGILSVDTEYRPLDNVKREEFVKMLVELADIALDDSSSDFSDISGDEWFVPYLVAAKKAGIVNGKEDGSFGVGENISRQDMVVMAQRTVNLMDKKLIQKNTVQEFSDGADISDYAKEAIGQMQAAGVVSGMGNGCFEPMGNANRAQAAVIICNLIDAMI